MRVCVCVTLFHDDGLSRRTDFPIPKIIDPPSRYCVAFLALPCHQYTSRNWVSHVLLHLQQQEKRGEEQKREKRASCASERRGERAPGGVQRANLLAFAFLPPALTSTAATTATCSPPLPRPTSSASATAASTPSPSRRRRGRRRRLRSVVRRLVLESGRWLRFD